MKKVLFVLAALLIIVPVLSQEVTREDALKAIEEAKKDMRIMINAGFSTNAINDSIKSANRALKRAEFAEALKNNATGQTAIEAREALEGLNYEGFTYADVLTHTNTVKQRKEKVFELSDRIRATEIKIENYQNFGLNTTKEEETLDESKTAFENERYTESENLLEQANSNLDRKRANLASFNIFLDSTKGIFQKYWQEILITTTILSIGGWATWKKISRRRKLRNLRKLNKEEITLNRLIRETQTDMFKRQTIPKLVYEIRMDKYNKRLNEIKKEKNILEGNLMKKGSQKKSLWQKVKDMFTEESAERVADKSKRTVRTASTKTKKAAKKVVGKPLTEVKGIGKATAQKLKKAGAKTTKELTSMNPKKLAEKSGVSVKRIKKFVKRAKE